MITIEKKYHFYAAHRNETLEDKCYNLHGHVYRIKAHIKCEVNEDSGVGILFGDIDKIIEPIIKSYDHLTLVHYKDEKLIEAMELLGTKYLVMDGPTSAENLARELYWRIHNSDIPIIQLDLSETESSTVSYRSDNQNEEDEKAD